jgi:hypothetical protein
MQPLRSLRIALALIIAPTLASAQTGEPQRKLGPIGDAAHWCTFTRPCNWASHAGIALGVAQAMPKLGVSREVAAGAAALLFVGKEVRDHLKWGDFGSRDSLGDLAAGLVGAYVGYRLHGREEKPGTVTPVIYSTDGDAAVGVRLKLR